MISRLLPDKVTCLSALSGLLMALSFPKPDISLFAWIGLIPLLLVMRHRPFKSGFIAGLVFFVVVLYWVNIVMTTYGHLPLPLSIVLSIILAAYLALFWGAATWASCRLKLYLNYPVTLTLPVLWVALEFVREFFLTGFPWATLGYSQHKCLTLIQSADLFGVYGLSFLLLLSNVVLAQCLLTWKQKGLRELPVRALCLLLLLFTLNFLYGYWSLQQNPERRSEQFVTTVVQGNIPQDVKWRPDNLSNTVKTYRDLSLQAERGNPVDLLVWPEAAMPFYFQDKSELSASVSALTEEVEAALLFGSPAYRREADGVRYLNSAFLLSPQRQKLGRSDKIHLVPFGEYVPLGKFLPFVNKLVAGIGDYSPGEINPLPLHGHKLGVLVCYEVIFPELARAYVRQGSDLLINITNDAWFGDSSAPWQHLAMARFRAIENRVWLARAANTGISAFISPTGRVVQQSALFETTHLTQKVGLGARPGFYLWAGDFIPTIFVLVAGLWLFQARRRTI